MKEITLTQGKVTQVDDQDYDWLIKWKWHYNNCGYAMRKVKTHGKQISIYMHRLIIGSPSGMEIDHINGDGLCNLRSNLRVCTHAENLQNQCKQKRNTSGYKGVSWEKRRGKWVAQITINQQNKFLGYYLSPAEAAKVYDETARKYYGEFANLNFPEVR